MIPGEGHPPPKELKLDKPSSYAYTNDCMKMLRNWPEKSHVFQICNKVSEACRPFGSNRLNKLDKAFDSILDEMFCSGTKLMLYVQDKELPKSKAEYESYNKLGKFQKHAKYPDPLVRMFIENNLILNLNNDQYHNLLTNQMKQMGEFKKEVKEAVSTLFDARFKLYKAIMTHDLIKTKLTIKTISKSQLLNLVDHCKKHEVKVSYEQIFGIQRTLVDVERKGKPCWFKTD